MFHVYVTNNIDYHEYFMAPDAWTAFCGGVAHLRMCRSGGVDFYEASSGIRIEPGAKVFYKFN